MGKVGEQVLSPGIIGVAKIVSSGTTYIRGYGTFPHPNLLSAFLVVGVLISAYLLINSTKFYQKALFSLALFINILGLTVTFSRAGFLAAGVGLIIFAGQTVINNWNSYKRTILTLLFLIIVSCLSSFIIFKPYLQTRATVTDQASLERIFYAKTAWKMIQHNPIFGVGIGESVIHMQQYSNVKLWPWQIQPAHNFFLLVTAELGIPGLILFLWFFISLLKKLVVSIRYDASNARDTLITKYLLLATFTSFLLLMQFDHYFYTLQQTQMLLWVFLGIIASQRKTPQEGELVL
ncbi:MAG: O-antigen ligase family protein [Candidatus Doudnabacteria bacterium]